MYIKCIFSLISLIRMDFSICSVADKENDKVKC